MRFRAFRLVLLLLCAAAFAVAPSRVEAGGRIPALYVAAGRTVEIYNATTGASIGSITPPTGEIHGLAVGLHGDV